MTFTGSIRFTGHDAGKGPLLDLTVKQPQVRVDGGKATLLLTCGARAWMTRATTSS